MLILLLELILGSFVFAGQAQSLYTTNSPGNCAMTLNFDAHATHVSLKTVSTSAKPCAGEGTLIELTRLNIGQFSVDQFVQRIDNHKVHACDWSTPSKFCSSNRWLFDADSGRYLPAANDELHWRYKLDFDGGGGFTTYRSFVILRDGRPIASRNFPITKWTRAR